jgi:hypothetical protein
VGQTGEASRPAVLSTPSKYEANFGKNPVRPGMRSMGTAPRLGIRVLPALFVVADTPAVDNCDSCIHMLRRKSGQTAYDRAASQYAWTERSASSPGLWARDMIASAKPAAEILQIPRKGSEPAIMLQSPNI